MIYGSVCSGIEAATVAWEPLGWNSAFYSEIEPFPSAVLAHHYPNVANLGDMTKFKEWPDATLDVLVGGTPCQSYSVAGLRKGLDDPRGNLMLTYGAIADKYRPRWLVWENVPGVLSSNGGRDFGTFLGMLGQLGYGFAYRVLDAQYFGVAQRRRRVFVVGYLGDWRRAAAVLFERHSLQGHSAPSRKAGEATSTSIIGGIDYEGNGHAAEEPTGPLLKGSPSGGGHPLPAICMATGKASAEIGIGIGIGTTLNCNHEAPIAFVQNTRDEVRLMNGDGQIAGALAAEPGAKQQCYVAFNLRGREGGAMPEISDLASIRSASGGSSRSYIGTNMQVRRLTPIECERLQGFPDNYTNIPWRGKGSAPDGPRYKALGNSMAVPVMAWIGQRIQQVEEIK